MRTCRHCPAPLRSYNRSGLCRRCLRLYSCRVCSARKGVFGRYCPDCLRLMEGLPVATRGTRPPPGLRAGLVAKYGARAAAGLPLFEGG